MENPVIIFGASELGRAAVEIFESNDIIVYGFLDDKEELHGQTIGELAILGHTEDDGFLKLIGKKCEAFIAVDDRPLRKGLVELIKTRRKMMPVNAIHSNTEIAPSAHVGHGEFINSGVVIGANARIGDHCIIHTNATIDYSAKLGDLVQVGAGSVIGSEAEIGENVFIGSGATIVPGIKIGKNARIGAGSVVVANVEEGLTVFGNPAKAV
ncbi:MULTISPECIES: acetyltransferase [Roseivirga]|jgi:sugar O-acyltransferase (sialic acid O-acetyltransferase NeuD family)|uniref:Acetyltransferase n=1 Tax=Roseivirga thermotolerans TaxID=1758176 RepID=A0ABQ3I3V1_9BACT|nr:MULTISPECIES: acetyltransferase [Roseivirga]MEC7753951.1 acetyltransferase [Bacteroidota bacterium]GHE61694.1 acetyltransferase [Roseivirga thermotolerans]|tara:strand:- start:976 stop:1608 length:633 start_codon:yes stop_codon:yes gene_type:complete